MANLPRYRTGWFATLSKIALTALLFETVTGLAVTLAPFSATVEWSLLLHTLVGLASVAPLTWYFWVHWDDYRRLPLSDVVLLGYVAVVALLVVSVSGLVVTWQGLFGLKTSPLWRSVHLISTLSALTVSVPHVALVYLRARRNEGAAFPARRTLVQCTLATAAGVVAVLGLTLIYPGPRYLNELPEGYQLVRGDDRPFAPSLARTASGGAYDADSLSGSESCGTAGCHEQIVAEWKPSAHRYAAMDVFFREVQAMMAEQNGPESTRYCGGCHDPISLFSGSESLSSKEPTDAAGFREGVSCLACHSVRETYLRGNANYVVIQPSAYLYQWAERSPARVLRDFLIRTYPSQHNQLANGTFRTPEHCAACHKQVVDEELGRAGWVQVQNQYDNWKASVWNVRGAPERTVECRECHMPLVDSHDPAAGDALDYNRSPDDGKHRSHRFIAANSMMPQMLQLEGWEEHAKLTERWLRGELDIPEIHDKWTDGPVIEMGIRVPEAVTLGDQFPVRVVLTANKIGHDFPTGPLDIIQSWVELHVTDEEGREVFSSGTRDEGNFIEPGSFLLKAEPVDQYGKLIDRRNLWEMAGVRYRRALFPGYSDVVEYAVDCPGALGAVPAKELERAARPVQDYPVPLPAARTPRRLHVTAALNYRKVDQSLLAFLLGESTTLTSPVIEMTRKEATIEVRSSGRLARLAVEGTDTRTEELTGREGG